MGQTIFAKPLDEQVAQNTQDISALNTNLDKKANVQVESVSLAPGASKEITVNNLLNNRTYFIMLCASNPGSWKYVGVLFYGQQYKVINDIGIAGITISFSDPKITITNTNASYSLTGNITIMH